MRRRREDKAYPKPSWTWAIIAAAVVGMLSMVSLFVSSAGRSAPTSVPTATTIPVILNIPSQTAEPTPFVANIQPWNGKDRFTVLIMGIDKRPGEEGRGFRTDTLILVSIDPTTNQIGILSVPRDIHVVIPGETDLRQINTAYVLGELRRPGFGPDLTSQAVQNNFGIAVDNYVVVSFDTVIKIVDALGGIDIEVPEPIDDPEFPDMYFGYDPLYIPAGLVHMDGVLALKFARTRHQGNDDYDRTRRQQQVILAIRRKALDMIPQLVTNAPTLWNEIGQGIITKMTLDEIMSMAWYLKDIPPEKIQRGTVEGKYLQAVSENGVTRLVINRTAIQELMIEVFGSTYNH
jgi:polyisoprenyl-teichoic acid--peptidoglycan teichoic acid transferase